MLELKTNLSITPRLHAKPFVFVGKLTAATLPYAVMKLIRLCSDPNEVKRSATKISWHPEQANKLAVSYSVMQFQGMTTPASVPLTSYVWDLNNPNQPDAEIHPTSPLTCLMYNPRSPDHIVGGSYNGLVGESII